MAHAHEKKGQPTWQDIRRLDLRHITSSGIFTSPKLLEAGKSREEAVQILLDAFSLLSENDSVEIPSHIGDVTVHARNMLHIAEKRQDARERYVNYAIETMSNPYEIWETSYEQAADEENPAREFTRLVFIGFFQNERTQMLVTVDTSDGNVLWNFMQQDKKSLNKHRHGILKYAK